MHVPNDLRRSSENKLLTFPLLPVLRGAGGLNESNLGLAPDLERVPHDIAMLRRPVPVEALTSPCMLEQDSLAHDARNLLTFLELFSNQLAEPGVLTAEHQHYAGNLRSLTGPLGALVERMATATAVEAQGEPVFVREPRRPPLANNRGARVAVAAAGKDPDNDAGVMVKSCERLLGSIAGPGVELNISCERDLGELALSGEGLTRVLINLVRNASEAMPEGGRVTITVRKGLGVRPNALVSVQDTGIGIPAHAIGQVFQAGFSSKKGQHRWPATMHYGLGLTIVRDLVEGAGGSVRIFSALKKGTTFEMKLPCRRC